MMDSQLTQSLADRPHVTGIAKRQSLQSSRNPHRGFMILEAAQSQTECLGLADFDHIVRSL
jgi:hypothetical protein